MIDIPELMEKLDRNDDVECYCPSCDNFTKLTSTYTESTDDSYYVCYECKECKDQLNYTSKIVDHNRRYVTEDEVSKV